jgi:3-oxoacyl-[acyl-carrier protein] reductase
LRSPIIRSSVGSSPLRRWLTIHTELNPAAGEWAVSRKALTALNRYGSVDDVAALAAFIAGPEASYITGASLTVDGGTKA